LTELEYKLARKDVTGGKAMTGRNRAVHAVFNYGDVVFWIYNDREVA
jgi:hypothetical protein